MTHVTCRLTAKNRERLRNPTLGNRVWATFTFFIVISDVGVNRPVLTELLQSQTLRHYQAASHALHVPSNATARPLRAYMALRPKIHRKLSNLILDARQAQR